MKYRFLFIFTLLAVTFGCNKEHATINDPSLIVVNPPIEKTALIRNPMMGWTLYDDANDRVANATDYWTAQNIPAKSSTIFYWRSRWSELEPVEGRYAWDYDENFKALIKGALDRGLKLAFCVYVDGQDNLYDATPLWVKDAGAKGYYGKRLWKEEGVDPVWSPYPDDPIFRAKFEKFIMAFAKRFDNPNEVDYIDAVNLGMWGEGHHLQFINPANKDNTFQWITDLYGNNFKKVILTFPFGSEFGWEIEKKYAIAKHDYIIRRNGLGSTWFLQPQIQTINSVFPLTAFIGEGCYWGGASDSYQPWLEDPTYKDKFKSWKDYYTQLVKDALNAHSNCLDLREAVEARSWLTNAKELVNKFIAEGGYRLAVTEIKYPPKVKATDGFKITHSWKNLGRGVCPNNNKRWNYKYKTAIAILNNANDNVVAMVFEPKAEPSKWLYQKEHSYTTNIPCDKIPNGDYRLAIGIIDTSDISHNDHICGLNLAIKGLDTSTPWYVFGNIEIK